MIDLDYKAPKVILSAAVSSIATLRRERSGCGSCLAGVPATENNPQHIDNMATLNKVVLIGNLTRDPELRSSPKGTPFCLLGLALNRRYKDESGKQCDETTFVDVEAWGRQAEVVSKYLKCGAPAFVEGRLKMDQWEDKESHQKRRRLKVIMESFQFIPTGSGRGNEVSEAGSPRENSGKGKRSRTGGGAGDHPATQPGDDIPF